MQPMSIAIQKLRNRDDLDTEIVSLVVNAKSYGLPLNLLYEQIKEKRDYSTIFQRLTKLTNAGYLTKNQRSYREVDYEPSTLTYLLVPDLVDKIKDKLLKNIKKIGYEEALKRVKINDRYIQFLEARGGLTDKDLEFYLEIHLVDILSSSEVVKLEKTISDDQIHKFLKKKNPSEDDIEFMKQQMAIAETRYKPIWMNKAREFIKSLKK